MIQAGQSNGLKNYFILQTQTLIHLYTLFIIRASEGILSRWSRLHLQLLVPANPHWARVVGYGPLSLCVIHKEGLCPSSGDINDDDDDTLLQNVI
jgi:hypothetical protein